MKGFDLTLSYMDGIFSQPILPHVYSVLVILGAFCLFVYYWSFRRFNLPPGPTGLPIVGYHPFLGKEPHKTLDNLSKKYGNVFSLKLGQTYVVVCNDWEAKTDAFNNSVILNRPEGLFDAVPNGFGIVSNNGPEWAEQKKFVLHVMKDLGLGKPIWEEMIQADVKGVVKKIQEQKDNLVDVNELFSDFFTASLMELVFGYHLPSNHPTLKYVNERMSIIMQSIPSMALRNFSPKLCSVLAKLGLYGSPEVLSKIVEFTSLVEDIVKKQLQDDGNENSLFFAKMYFQEVKNNSKQNLKNSFTESTLYANAQALLVGGIDTTKDTTSWLLAAMADFQEVQSKVHEELDSVLGRDGEITWSMRMKIPYTFACVYEALRWKTLMPINPLRVASEDTKILGFDVPKGSFIAANNWALHNDSRYWPDPDKFDPERFLIDGGKKVNTRPDSFSPFSQGRRNCPGEQLSLLNILLFFVSLMQKYRILPEDSRGVQCDTIMGMTVKPIKLKLRFISRE